MATNVAAQLQHDYKLWVCSWNMAAKEHFPDSVGGNVTKKDIERVAAVIPTDYEIYVLGVQECISETFFEVIDRHLAPHRVFGYECSDNRVYGRGDGSFLNQKFTGVRVWVREAIQRNIRIERFASVSMGVLEGSKGAACVAMSISGTTIVFVGVHMSSNSPKDRQQNFKTICEKAGEKLGEKHFDLLEQFHHVVWFGDTNYRITTLTAKEVVQHIHERKFDDLWNHDSLMRDLLRCRVFFGFKEPRPRPDFYPTYKKIPERKIDYPHMQTIEKIETIYRTKYKEPMYKGGGVHDRIPSFCDRILVHTLPEEKRTLSVQLDSSVKARPFHRGVRHQGVHNYGCIYDHWLGSDHTGVYCGFDIKPFRMLTKTPREMSENFGEARHYCISVLQIQGVRGPKGKIKQVPQKFRVLFPAPFEDGNNMPQSKLMKREHLENFNRLNSELLQQQEDSEFSTEVKSQNIIKQELGRLKNQLTVLWKGNNRRPAETNLHCLFRCTFRDGETGQGVIVLNVDEVFNLEPFKTQEVCKKMNLTKQGLPVICPLSMTEKPMQIQVIVRLEVSIQS